MKKPYLQIDFDGVINSYKSGWTGATDLPDPPVEGAIEALIKYLEEFKVCIVSSRSRYLFARHFMKKWMVHHFVIRAELAMNNPSLFEDSTIIDFCNSTIAHGNLLAAGRTLVKMIRWPKDKQPAIMSIDDRGYCFTGQFPSTDAILSFKPWNKIKPSKRKWVCHGNIIFDPVNYGTVSIKTKK